MNSGRDRGSRDRGEGEGRGRSDRGRSSRFEYQRRDSDSVKKRGEQSAGDYDNYVNDQIRLFKPADGDNVLRILPPTWKDAEHFGLDIFVHYNVGPDQQTYLCLDKMKGEACPVCDERNRALKDNDQDYADKLKPSKRVLVYLIDREHEKDGPFAWSMPWTMDRDLCKLVVDKKTGEVLPIDDPESGYDIEFERKGKGERTQYIGLSIARRESDLGNDAWLEYIQDNPLPEILVYYDYDHIAKAFGGASRKNDGDSESSARSREGSRSSKSSSSPKDLSWDDIHDMKFKELQALIEDEKLKINPDESKDDEELADWICEDLGIKKVSKRQEATSSEEEDKLEKMRSRRRSVE